MRKLILVATLGAITVAIWFLDEGSGLGDVNVEKVALSVEEKEQKFESAKELTGIAGYLNTDSIKLSDVIGQKVILVDFWTYSCINCKRTLPYLNAWYEKYRNQGFEIIGVHTPEFEFEKDYDNVALAIETHGIEYPVVQDNDYATWRAYSNSYWPRKYLIDIDGYIVYDHIGEGSYEETEEIIKTLLAERARKLSEDYVVDEGIVKPRETIGVDFNQDLTRETYFGAWRNSTLANAEQGVEGVVTLTIPKQIEQDLLYLDGSWNVEREYAESANNSRILIDYYAKNVYIVARSDEPVFGQVLVDGVPAGDLAGGDVDQNGIVEFSADRLYDLIGGEDYGRHTLEIIIEDPGLQVFTFTFG